MRNNFARHITLFVIIIVLQILVLNTLGKSTGFHAFPMISLVLMLPIDIKRYPLLIISCLIGFGFDLFFDTLGFYASAFTIIGFFRPRILSLFSPKDGYESNKSFTIKDMGYRWFLYYYGLSIFIFSLWCSILSWLHFKHTFAILMLTIETTVLSLLVLLVLQLLVFKPRRNG
jgi:hypothetical protein